MNHPQVLNSWRLSQQLVRGGWWLILWWGINMEAAEPTSPRKAIFHGQVKMTHEALQQRGVKAYASELQGQVVLETPEGKIWPIVPDWRGRAFYQDARLRQRPVVLVAFEHRGVPFLQVLQIYLVDDHGHTQYMDYYCDTCAIPMYEIKPCDCCQQEIRLRLQARAVPDDVPRYETLSACWHESPQGQE
ncbi:MAG: hypothetical protein KatS3mg113_0012 [Planctomycetaceae bacterium]|nr:MAG: hypothetical protein KatS3mg113_0012 [Planctomycetaceae bacterium]